MDRKTARSSSREGSVVRCGPLGKRCNRRPRLPGHRRGRVVVALKLFFFAVVVVLTLTRIIKSVVTGQAPVTLELRNTLGKNTDNPRWCTHISQLTQFMPPPETHKSEIGSQSTGTSDTPLLHGGLDEAFLFRAVISLSLRY